MRIRMLKTGLVIFILIVIVLPPWIHALKLKTSSAGLTSNIKPDGGFNESDSAGFKDLIVPDDNSDDYTDLSTLDAVTVYAVADEEYRTRFFGRWRTKMIADIGRAGLRFMLFAATPVVVRSVGTWDSTDTCHDAHELLSEVRWEVDKGSCDVVVAFTGQKIDDNIAGVAECPGDDVLCSIVGNMFMDNLIQHEMSHLFGCRDHIPGWGIPCVMSYAYWRFMPGWCPHCLQTINGA